MERACAFLNFQSPKAQYLFNQKASITTLL